LQTSDDLQTGASFIGHHTVLASADFPVMGPPASIELVLSAFTVSRNLKSTADVGGQHVLSLVQLDRYSAHTRPLSSYLSLHVTIAVRSSSDKEPPVSRGSEDLLSEQDPREPVMRIPHRTFSGLPLPHGPVTPRPTRKPS
jgi:hypothetical protein